MPGRLLPIVFLLTICSTAHGQDPYEYYYNNSLKSDGGREIVFERDLFLRPVTGSGDLFTLMSEFNFSAVKYSRRGYGHALGKSYLGNIDLLGLLSDNPDYTVRTNLRRAAALRTTYPGLAGAGGYPGFVGDTEVFSADVLSLVPSGQSVTLYTYNRRGRAGVNASSGGRLDSKSNYALWMSRRFGRDATVQGVFSDEVSFVAGVDRRFSTRDALAFMLTGSWSESGLRSYATREAFRLTENNYYNPSWGRYDGQERSARVSKTFRPLAMLSYVREIGKSTILTASLSYRFGKEKRSGLAWFGAQTPFPDYYRYMPGGAYNPAEEAVAAEKWRSGDERFTQIDWGQLIEQNVNNPDHARYLLENRVEEFNDLQFAVSATGRIGEHTKLSYGGRLRMDDRRYYKEVADLLGASATPDVDQYLMDDDVTGGKSANDLRNPGRLVDEGDRFGYNYRLTASRTEAYVMLDYFKSGLRFAGSLEIAGNSVRRTGYYEKEQFPGNASYGRSKEYGFNTYAAKATLGYSPSGRHFAEASAMTAASAPYAGNIFLSPDYSNVVIGNPETMALLAAEASYGMVLNRLSLKISGFAAKTSRESAVYRYWDDIAAQYSNMILRGVDKVYAGAEIGGQYNFTPRLSLMVAASAGSYKYDSDPRVTILNDATQHEMVAGAKSYLKGYRLADSPQRAATAEIRYNSFGWLGTLTLNYMGDRYVDATPLRRMARAYSLAPERFEEFVGQEKLGDVVTLDIFLLKSFYLPKGVLTVMGSVGNLLGNTDIVYNGYEQMRIMRRGSEPNRVWTPFPNKYLYGYGRTFYLSVKYSF